MASKPVWSNEDKEHIKSVLQSACEQLWISQGYKKTSIKALCSKTNIAVGSFYSLYTTKEDLFFETVKTIQTRLTDQFMRTVLQGSNKDSLAKAMKELYREFDRKPFLYDVNTPDFKSFVTKLSPRRMEEIQFESISFFRDVCKVTSLRLKVDEVKAVGILSALLSTIVTKETLAKTCDYLQVFDFMVDHLVSELFE